MHIGLSSGQCKPLYCQGYQVGLVRNDVEEAIEPFKDVFSISTSQIDIMPMYNHVAQTKSTFEEISKNIDNVLQSLRDSPDHDFLALKGWRNECYNIRPSFSSPPLFKMERSATCKITSSNMSRRFFVTLDIILPLLFTNSTLHIFCNRYVWTSTIRCRHQRIRQRPRERSMRLDAKTINFKTYLA